MILAFDSRLFRIFLFFLSSSDELFSEDAASPDDELLGEGFFSNSPKNDHTQLSAHMEDISQFAPTSARLFNNPDNGDEQGCHSHRNTKLDCHRQSRVLRTQSRGHPRHRV